MFTKNNIVYAEAGNLLIGKNKKGFQLSGNKEDFYELPINYKDMHYDGKFLRYNNNTLMEAVNNSTTYESLKTKFIKQRYSNDDQIAILLNKDSTDDGLEKYNKMQEWRDWSGTLAKAIMAVVKNE